MYRVLAISVFLAAAVFPLSLESQMRAIQRPIAQARISAQPHFRAMPLRPAGSPVIISTHRSGRQGLFVGTGASPRHFRFNIFSGNPCVSNTFFDPFFCHQFFFPDRFPFTEPVFLPYPIITAPYYPVEKEAPPTQVVVVQAAPAAAPAPQPAPESLPLDWRRDHWERVTSYGQPVTSSHSDYSKRSNRRPPSTRNRATTQPSELPAAVLVYRDGRKEEVSSYTIVGGTMYTKADYWTSGSWTKKIQLADLDLPATLRLNQERGVNFALPAARYEVVIR